jgi:pimeloyl-ACP methyl ester carboxylesterase
MKVTVKLIFGFILFGLIPFQNKESERMVIFNDYQLHINETGHGQPTVIIEAALGSGLDSYDNLQTAISKLTKVLSYDRPGLGRSSKSPNPRSLRAYSKILVRKLGVGQSCALPLAPHIKAKLTE